MLWSGLGSSPVRRIPARAHAQLPSRRAIGETCGSTQVNSSSQSVIDPQQASARQGGSQDIGQASGQANGPAQITSAPPAAGASSALPGLNSLSGAIPNLSNAASVVPNVGNAAGSVTSGNGSITGAVSNLVPGNGNGGLDSVSNAVGGITGGLSGSQNGGPATGPLP